jgi:hypothetical protein
LPFLGLGLLDPAWKAVPRPAHGELVELAAEVERGQQFHDAVVELDLREALGDRGA